jgi:hypothetical protein
VDETPEIACASGVAVSTREILKEVRSCCGRMYLLTLLAGR